MTLTPSLYCTIEIHILIHHQGLLENLVICHMYGQTKVFAVKSFINSHFVILMRNLNNYSCGKISAIWLFITPLIHFDVFFSDVLFIKN